MKPLSTALTIAALALILLPAIMAEVSGLPVPSTTYTPGDTYTKIYCPTQVPAPNGSKPPKVTIISPIDRQVSSSINLTLAFNLTLEASSNTYPITLDSLCYKLSWESNNITAEIDSHRLYMNETLPFSINLIGIPEGNQSITVYARTFCEYETRRELLRQPVSQSGFIVGNFLYVDSNFYVMADSSTVNFTIGALAPVAPPDDESDADTASNILLAVGIAGIVTALFLVILKLMRRSRERSGE